MKKGSKTLVTAPPTFSVDGSIRFVAPKSWRELTQAQLRYVLFLITTFKDAIEVKTYMFFRFCGIKVKKHDRFGWICRVAGRDFTITVEQVESLLGQFSYIDSYDDLGVRLDDVDGHHAVDVLLHDIRFLDYLNAEKYYQLYQQSEDDKFIVMLACLLYRDKKGRPAKSLKMDKAEIFGTLIWYAWVKKQFSYQFPSLFKPASSAAAAEYDIVSSMNTQIRALTDGDVTKEQQIYDTDCWRALTELNFKAREADEHKKQMAKYNKK